MMRTNGVFFSGSRCRGRPGAGLTAVPDSLACRGAAGGRFGGGGRRHHGENLRGEGEGFIRGKGQQPIGGGSI